MGMPELPHQELGNACALPSMWREQAQIRSGRKTPPEAPTERNGQRVQEGPGFCYEKPARETLKEPFGRARPEQERGARTPNTLTGDGAGASDRPFKGPHAPAVCADTGGTHPAGVAHRCNKNQTPLLGKHAGSQPRHWKSGQQQRRRRNWALKAHALHGANPKNGQMQCNVGAGDAHRKSNSWKQQRQRLQRQR